MNNYGGIIVPSLTFARKRAMIYKFFMANTLNSFVVL